jgi:hypothetical protein
MFIWFVGRFSQHNHRYMGYIWKLLQRLLMLDWGLRFSQNLCICSGISYTRSIQSPLLRRVSCARISYKAVNEDNMLGKTPSVEIQEKSKRHTQKHHVAPAPNSVVHFIFLKLYCQDLNIRAYPALLRLWLGNLGWASSGIYSSEPESAARQRFV